MEQGALLGVCCAEDKAVTWFLAGATVVNIMFSIALARVVLDMRRHNDSLEREVKRLRNLVLPLE